MTVPDIAIVMAAGDGSRWGNYYGVPKHLLEVDGETLLSRTVRMLQEYISEVWVIAPKDLRYHRHSGHTLTVTPRRIDEKILDTDKFYSSIRLWHGDDHSLLVYGDCFFTPEAIATMCQPVDEWTLYCRSGASSLTGAASGECWAFSIPICDHDWFKERLEWLTGMYALGQAWRCGGWELYRAMCRQPVGTHTMEGGHYCEIDDFTEDFDYSSDYDMWREKRQLPPQSSACRSSLPPRLD